jgi:pyruvate-formate lyase-activating enzyme
MCARNSRACQGRGLEVQLGLLITQRCNAQCAHCATSCGPDKTAELELTRIFKLMDEAAALRRPGKRLVFSLSGGEAFLDLPKLRAIVAHGKHHGGEVTCVSNGYWAASDDKARVILTELKDAGLVALGVSTSRFHRQFVKLDRVKRALRTAVDVGIRAVLKYPVTRDERADAEELQAWARGIGVQEFEIEPVQPYVREGSEIPETDLVTQPGLPEGVCPSASLTIREDGMAYTCCAPGGFNEFLALGNALEQGLRGTYGLYLLGGKQKLLREAGPIHFARAIQARGAGHRLRRAYGGICDLCAHIGTDPALAAIAQDEADRYEIEYLTRDVKLTVESRPR